MDCRRAARWAGYVSYSGARGACRFCSEPIVTGLRTGLASVRFATGPKRSMGHFLGAEKGNFLIRVADRRSHHGGRACGILSIPAKQVSLGSPRVGTIHVQAPTPHAPALQAFLADFSQQTTRFSHLLAMVCFQGSRRALDCRIDGVCGAGAYPLPDLPREASRSRSAPEKSV